MFVHSSRIKKQIEYMQSRGVDPRPVYGLAEISPDEISDPDKMFSFEQFHEILKYAIDQSGDEFYGLKMGQEPHIAGTVGMLAASCRNLREAFVQGCRFFKVQGNFADIEFMEKGPYPKIRYTLTNAWQLKFPETASHEVDAMFSFLTAILKVNSNGMLKPHKVYLKREKPENSSPYLEVFGSKPIFGSEVNELYFKESDLKIPMKAFNPETYNLLKAYIEKQLRKFGNQESVSEKVKSVLLSSVQYQFPDIELVASRLKISTRTLQRQLSKESTSFKSILQDTRFSLAKQMLKQDKLTISEISYTLGYSDLGNFSRSFKNYAGKSPQEFRAG